MSNAPTERWTPQTAARRIGARTMRREETLDDLRAIPSPTHFNAITISEVTKHKAFRWIQHTPASPDKQYAAMSVIRLAQHLGSGETRQ